MRVLVAGGRGFIGRHVCARLERAGHDVDVTGRGEPLRASDAVIHLGLFDEATTLAVVAELAGRPLIVASSGDVYFIYDQILGREPWDGVQPEPVAEDAQLRTQLYPYGRTARTPNGAFIDYDKILVERVALEAGAMVLRLPKVYGPEQPVQAHRVIGERVAAWKWTHGHVDDVARAFECALTRFAAGRVYNVGEPDPPPLVERWRAIAGEVAIVADAEVPEVARVPISQPVNLVYDVTRFARELG